VSSSASEDVTRRLAVETLPTGDGAVKGSLPKSMLGTIGESMHTKTLEYFAARAWELGLRSSKGLGEMIKFEEGFGMLL